MTEGALKAAVLAKPKRKNTSAKGQKLEGLARAILEHEGYAVATAGKVLAWTPRGPRSKQHDLFGCIDLIATQRSHIPVFVQVTDKHNRRARERKATAYARGYTSPDAVIVQVWAFVGGRRPKGQRFLVTEWNNLEWADCTDRVCVQNAAVLP